LPHASAPAGPVVIVRLAPDGRPVGAAATARIERGVDEVWAVLADVERYASFLPMVHRARRKDDDVTYDLKFRIGFFSVGFQFTARATWEEGKWLELRWLSGEPAGIRLRFELTPLDEGRACEVTGDGEFELHSLGWLVKYFLKHHPEIQHGIFPGVALVLIDSLKRALAV
jgi:ribosome-associated toxin RatA of RatAB toxin-antitoxin module